MPKGLAVGRIQRQEIAVAVAGKRKSRIGRKHSGPTFGANVVTPANFAGLIVDGIDHALAPNAIVGASPAINSIGRLGKIDAPAGMSTDNEQTVLGIEARGSIVGESALIGGDQASVRCRLLRRIRDRAAVFINSERPIYRSKRNGQQTFSVGAVEHEEVSVTRGLHQHLPRLPAEFPIDQPRDLYSIPVVSIVWRSLKGPHQLTRVGIERDYRAGVEIVTGPGRTVQNRGGIARTPVNQIEIGIVCPGHPGHAAGGLIRSSRGRRTVPLPLRFSGLWIDGPNVARNVIQVSRNANQDATVD